MLRVCLVDTVVFCTMRYLDDAEQIPIRIFQYDEISMRGVPPRVACCAELNQPFHFALLVRRIEIKVQPTPLANSPGGGLIQRDVYAVPNGISKDYEATIRIGMLNLIVKRSLPERKHAIVFMTAYDD